jgi:hypothetical protein
MGRARDWLAAADVESDDKIDTDVMKVTRRLLVSMMFVIFGVLPALFIINFIVG